MKKIKIPKAHCSIKKLRGFTKGIGSKVIRENDRNMKIDKICSVLGKMDLNIDLKASRMR